MSVPHHVAWGSVLAVALLLAGFHLVPDELTPQQPDADDSFENDDEFLVAWLAQELPFEQWTHRAHVRIAFILLTRMDGRAASRVVREGIIKFNEANKEKVSTGFHETITEFWMRTVAHLLREEPLDDDISFAAWAERPLVRRVLTPRHLFAYYSHAFLFAKASPRQRFMHPDLCTADDGVSEERAVPCGLFWE